MQDSKNNLLKEVYNQAKLVFGEDLRDVYLYGSYARGDYTEDSDIDFLVTVNASSDEISKLRHLISKASSRLSLQYDITFSVTVKPLEQFNKYSSVLPYYQNVLKEGIKYAN